MTRRAEKGMAVVAADGERGRECVSSVNVTILIAGMPIPASAGSWLNINGEVPVIAFRSAFKRLDELINGVQNFLKNKISSPREGIYKDIYPITEGCLTV